MTAAIQLERLLVARSSADLSISRSVRRLSDAEILAANGMAATGLDPLASVLAPLLGTPSQADMEAANRAMMKVVRNLSLRHQWRLHEVNVKLVAMAAVLQYARPACTHCGGTSYSKTGAICTHCSGTGKRAAPAMIRDWVEASVSEMRAAEGRLGAAIGRRS